jgi:enamine deaminase RidA (YjgF/YER057c/UK114 family)
VFRSPRGRDDIAPGTFHVAVPALTANDRELLLSDLEPFPGEGLELYRNGARDLIVGRARAPFAPATLVEDTRRLYRRILHACTGRHLYRVWNYLPRINECADGLEHYRAFCLGRADAFELAFGAGFHRRVPAASAVGSEGDTLEVIFTAGTSPARHVENPEQIPAYRYPPEYGPRPPSFARATVVDGAPGTTVYISGTGAIKGHTSVAPDDLEGQIEVLVRNLKLVAAASGAGNALEGDDGWQRRFKVYLRRAADQPRASERLQALFTPRDDVVWLRTDLCRTELRMEVEATLTRLD